MRLKIAFEIGGKSKNSSSKVKPYILFCSWVSIPLWITNELERRKKQKAQQFSDWLGG